MFEDHQLLPMLHALKQRHLLPQALDRPVDQQVEPHRPLAARADVSDDRDRVVDLLGRAEREEAKAFSELELTTADPLTIVLSEKGWIRAAKGHDIDPAALSYKSGDGFRFAVRGKSNLPTVVLDSTGRAYTLPTHQLPSARGQGEPLTGRINPPSGATFQGLLTGAERDRYLLASDAGYGFVVQFGQLQAKNKAGKAVLTLPKGAHVLPPASIAEGEEPLVVVATNEGRMLVFPLADLPEMARGKGNKLIGIPTARAAAREEARAAVSASSPST